MERFLIVRMGAMGDIVHGLPAVALLRQQFPQAHIGWVIERRWSDLLRAQGSAPDAPLSAEKPLVNSIFEVNTKSWRRALFAAQTRRELRDVVEEIREEDFDVTIDLQGSLKSAFAARMTKTPKIIGPAKPREFPAQWAYTVQVETRRAHVIEQYAELVAPLLRAYGKPAADARLLPVDRSSEQWREKEIVARGLAQWRYAVLSAGAGWKAKEWPAPRFAELARQLAKDGIRCLVNVGPSEGELGDAIQRASGGHAQPIRCNIAQLIALIRKASLFVGGDTGPMHIANLLGVPVVAVFGPTDPARNGPYFQPSAVLRNPASSTDYSHAKTKDPGLAQITVEQVLQAARNLMMVKA
jgi:heptosyltransferase I